MSYINNEADWWDYFGEQIDNMVRNQLALHRRVSVVHVTNMLQDIWRNKKGQLASIVVRSMNEKMRRYSNQSRFEGMVTLQLLEDTDRFVHKEEAA